MSGYDIQNFIKAASSASLDPSRSSQAPSQAAVPTAEGVSDAVLRKTYSPIIFSGLVRLLEYSVIVLAGVTLHQIYLSEKFPFDWLYSVTVFGAAGLVVIAFQTIGLYSISNLRQFGFSMFKLAGAWSVLFLLFLALLFFAKIGDNFSRLWLGSWYVLGFLGLVLCRFIVSLSLSSAMKAGRFERRTAIVGGGEACEPLLKALQAQYHSGIKVVGLFDDRDDDRSPDVIAGYPKLGSVDDLVEYSRKTKLDLVIFALPISAEGRILQMLKKLWVLPIDIRLAAHSSKLHLRPRSYSYIGDVPVLDVFDRPIADWDLVLKWIFDKFVGTISIVLCSPVLLVTALLIKIDSKGPVFFKQKRYGFNNELIEVYKFRSMHVETCDATASKLVTKDDPRVTRVGRFIRKTSIDELPQLINVVLKGNLSLVGPRPHALHAKAEDRLYDEAVDGYFARHKVKPGITGWAQIKGWRGETDTHEKIQKRVEHDLYYIENWSVFFDLYILILTPFALFDTKNAY